MLARGALCRLAAEVPKQATQDLPKLATLVQNARSGFALPVRTLSHALQLQTRSYATTKAAQDPAAPVKKAVKAKAAAGEKVTKTTTKTKATTKKAASKKAAPKKAKKKAAPKKAAKSPRKVLTAEEKQKAVIDKLRKIALKEPVSSYKLSAFNVFIGEASKGCKVATTALSNNSKLFKDISPAERENINHLTVERNEARLAEYKAWVLSHTPEQIRLANNARALLKKKLAGTSKNPIPNTRHITDERHVKRPLPAWIFFFSERNPSSDFEGIAPAQRVKLISSEWKALSTAEKQRFVDQAAADRQRFARESAALKA